MKQDRDTKIGERAKAIVKAKASMEALRKAQAAPKRPMPKEPTTGGSGTVPMTPEREEFLKEMAKRNAKPGMKKGGKAKANPFGATKFGSAMMKKSADTKGRAMVKKAGGGKCYASGGKVKKMAVGGMPMTTAMGGAAPTTPPMQSSPMPSGTPQTPPATGNATGNPAQAMAQMQASRGATPANPHPQMVKSATTNVNTGVRTPSMFDRNAALKSFNAQARGLLNQGVPMKEIVAQQAMLRKLQMDNASNSGQHSTALADALKRMQGMVPKKSSPQVDKRYASGGLASGHKAANGVAKKGLTKGKQVKMNKGGACYAKGGSVRSIDGIATKGKTRCKGARK
jgi:hypothetical protein